MYARSCNCSSFKLHRIEDCNRINTSRSARRPFNSSQNSLNALVSPLEGKACEPVRMMSCNRECIRGFVIIRCNDKTVNRIIQCLYSVRETIHDSDDIIDLLAVYNLKSVCTCKFMFYDSKSQSLKQC